jgi:hypothetical protein
MANYIIIGGDLKEYGPIPADDVRQWIAEGRLNEQSRAKAEGEGEFRQLEKFPEFAAAFAPKTASPETPPPFAGTSNSTAVSQGDYDLDIFGCIANGWELVKNNFGTLFVAALLVTLIEGAIGGMGSIPLAGPLFTIANMIVAGPLMGGLFYVFLQTIRGGSAEVGDVFAGFRKNFGQLFLGHLVPGLLIGLCLIPFAVVLAFTLVPLFVHGQLAQPGQTQEQVAQAIINAFSKISIWPLALTAFVCIIPVLYLQTCWVFTLPLIMDKEMDFWTAMNTSRKQVGKHWWHIFGLVIVVGLLNLVGVLLCCVGVLFTMPIGFAALMFAYETIFSERRAH